MELYPKYILLLGNPLEEKFSLLLNHPKVYFSDSHINSLKSGVKHMFERVRAKNQFRDLRSIEHINK